MVLFPVSKIPEMKNMQSFKLLINNSIRNETEWIRRSKKIILKNDSGLLMIFNDSRILHGSDARHGQGGGSHPSNCLSHKFP